MAGVNIIFPYAVISTSFKHETFPMFLYFMLSISRRYTVICEITIPVKSFECIIFTIKYTKYYSFSVGRVISVKFNIIVSVNCKTINTIKNYRCLEIKVELVMVLSEMGKSPFNIASWIYTKTS
ncbi:hypothetical protein DLR11_03200 [Salmonella enterica subsp. salamae]|nr:hypothetical protein [Salmonella enterica subsp. salamae]